MAHLDEDAILRYINETMCDEELYHTDSHMAECQECLERVQTVFYIKENFNTLWSSWNAAEIGRVHRMLEQEKTHAESPENAEAVRSGFKELLGRLDTGKGLAIKILIDPVYNSVLAAAGVMAEGYEARLLPAFAGVGSPEAVEAGEKLRRGSELLAQGKTEASLEVAREAGKSDARAVQASTIEIRRGDKLYARVVIDGRKHSAAVICWPDDGESVTSAVLLPADGRSEPLVSGFVPVDGADYRLAEFRNLSAGEYELSMIAGD